jgi:hypothetical protein
MSDARFDRIENELTGFRARFDGVDARLDELRRHTLVLHEAMMERFAAQREFSGPTRTEFAELKDLLRREFGTLKAVVRQNSVDIRQNSIDINELKRTRQ